MIPGNGANIFVCENYTRSHGRHLLAAFFFIYFVFFYILFDGVYVVDDAETKHPKVYKYTTGDVGCVLYIWSCYSHEMRPETKMSEQRAYILYTIHTDAMTFLISLENTPQHIYTLCHISETI